MKFFQFAPIPFHEAVRNGYVHDCVKLVRLSKSGDVWACHARSGTRWLS